MTAFERIRQFVGVMALDLPRLFPILLVPKAWVWLTNRSEPLDKAPSGPGVACRGEWSSDIHACTVVPLIGRLLQKRALHEWPIRLVGDAKPPARPQVTFVIPHRGRERLPLLLRTVESILGQRGVDVECVVVEQAARSEIDSAELPSGVKHVVLIHPGEPEPWRKSWAFNRGVAEAAADIVVCHDGDILVPEGYALEVMQFLGGGEFDVAHLQRFLFCLSEPDTREMLRNECLPIDSTPERVRQNWRGGTVAIRKEAFKEIGGFDESFVGWGGEDIEFYDRCRSLKQQRFGYLPFVHLWHPAQDTKFGEKRERGLQLMQERLLIPRADRISELRARCRSEYGALSTDPNALPRYRNHRHA